MKQLQLISSEDAVPTDEQITKPCSDCPFARSALNGWLGGSTPQEYIQLAHSDNQIDCHTLDGPQCAGAAIYRANMAKSVRDPQVLRLPADRERVFKNPMEFIEHHSKGALTQR